MNHYDVSVLPSEARYWMMIIGAVVSGFLLVKYFDNLSQEKREPYLKRLGCALLLTASFLPVYTILIPEHLFSYHRSLPLHFCSLNIWLIGFNCFFRSRKLFVYTFFMGLIGGFYSVLTPLLTVGDAPLVMIHYVIVHTSLFAVPIVMIRLYGMRLKYYDWIRGYLFAAAISTVMVFINSFLNLYVENTGDAPANYMFVSVAPAVSNPFLFEGLQWPFYLFPIHVGLLLHFFIINVIYRKREQNAIVTDPQLWQ